MEATMAAASWFCEQEWDHIFNNLPPVDWDTDNNNTPSTPVQQLGADLDAAEWLSWHDLIINDCSLNNLSLPAELQTIEEYLLDEELEDDSNDMEQDLISSPTNDAMTVFQCPIDSSADPVTLEHPAGDQLVQTNSSSSESKSMMTDNAGSSSVDVDDGSFEYKGLRLLHLLTACAEAMWEGAQDLVDVILWRLRGLVSSTGTTMERVAYYLYRALLHSNADSLAHLMEPTDESSNDNFLGALQLLHVAYPYVRIPHFTANQCILEAVAGGGGTNNNVRIHIIDFDIMEGMQWPPLMESLKNIDVAHLTITAIKWAEDEEDECVLYSGHTGRRLSEYASSAGIPFSYQETDLQGLKGIPLSQEGEIVVVNCMWQLPHMFNLRNKSHLFEFLVGARRLNPVAVTLATGPHGTESGTTNFLESFVRRLEELCAIFDSVEAGLPEHGLASAMVERFFFGPAMSKRVLSARSNDNTDSNVVDLPFNCGYGEGSISNENMICAKYSLPGSGCYEVEKLGDYRVVLKWGSTPLVWVSTWKSPSSDHHDLTNQHRNDTDFILG